jgi:hypothetical protein
MWRHQEALQDMISVSENKETEGGQWPSQKKLSKFHSL